MRSGLRDRRHSLLASALLAAAVVGCGTPPLEQRCSMVRETVVAEGEGSFIRAVALARGHGALLAAWSDLSGTRVRRLGLDGVPVAPALRVAAPAVSLDLAVTAEGFALGTLAPGDLLWGGGSAGLVRLDGRGRPSGRAEALGRAGAYSRGISVAEVGGELLVAWQDGTPGSLRVMLARSGVPAASVSDPLRPACCPSITAGPSGEALVVWGEVLALGADSRVVARRVRPGDSRVGPALVLARSAADETWPVVLHDPDGLDVFYRDAPGGRREGLFFLRTDHGGRPLAEPFRVGRYDGPGRAVVFAFPGHLTAVELRSWSREWIVALDRFDRRGRRLGAQYHLFADHVRFTDVDAVVAGGRYLLLYGEENPSQRVWLGELRCR